MVNGSWPNYPKWGGSKPKWGRLVSPAWVVITPLWVVIGLLWVVSWPSLGSYLTIYPATFTLGS